jgi:hypothetical protein
MGRYSFPLKFQGGGFAIENVLARVTTRVFIITKPKYIFIISRYCCLAFV